MIISAFLQVFSRFVLGKAFSWTDELCRYCLVWLVFIGAGVGVYHNKHICIDVLYNKFPMSIKKALDVINIILSMTMASVMVVKGIYLVQNGMTQRSPSLQIPFGFLYLSIPISGLLILLFCIDKFLSLWKHEEEEGSD